MRHLSGAKVTALAVAACGCWAYLWFFFLRLFAFYGLPSVPVACLAAAACMVIGLYRPIPVKMRTVWCMYIGFYGILTDVLGLFLTGPVYTLLHRSGLLVALLSALSVLYGLRHGRQTVQKNYTVPSPLRRPVRIALVSDIHMGFTVDETRLADTLARVKEERPDILCIAGDISDDTTSPEDLRLAAGLLGAMPCPVYAVLGNHDVGYKNEPMRYTEAAYRAALAENSIRLLDDDLADCGDFCLLGRRDRWVEGREDIEDLPTPAKPCIVLDHQPFDYKENASLGAFLQLSGHTHGAQVFPLSVLGRLLPGFYGLHRYHDLTVITSCGLGSRGHRLHSGCTAEYVIIDLVPNEGA